MIQGDRGQERRRHLVQGEFAVSAEPALCLTTLLGSCVAACLWDADAGVGGMNHFLLPEAPEGATGDRRYGVQSMELLINDLLKRGARRDRLSAKVFGGARMTDALADIGRRNADFVQVFLKDEAIPIRNASLGGDVARRIQFWPASGRVRQHFVQNDPALRQQTVKPPMAPSGDLELF